MNRERCKELLPIIQAFAEGKTIQFDNNHNRDSVIQDGAMWGDIDEDDMISMLDKYPVYAFQIKSAPMECWIPIHKELSDPFQECPYMDIDEAKDCISGREHNYEIKHFREVTE